METMKKKSDVDCTRLLKTLVEPPQLSHLPQIAHGIKHEPIAIEKVLENLNRTHKDVAIKECGLFIHSTKPYLGASPDGIVSCSCCKNSRLLEIKCPSPDTEVLSYLSDGKLKQKCGYFGQVQGQMMVTNVHETYFCVYKNDAILLQTIKLDEEFCAKMVKNLDKFFHQFLGPKLLEEPSRKHRKV